MPEAVDPRPGQSKGGRTDSKRGLLQALRDAHEVDHEILAALGIKHPHIPILSVIEMLGPSQGQARGRATREQRRGSC